MRGSRNSHAGRNKSDREDYARLLKRSSVLDDTEEAPLDDSQTNTPQINDVPKPKNRKPKSFGLKALDFFNNNLLGKIVIGIVIAVLGSMLWLAVNTNREVGVVQVEVSTLKDRVTRDEDQTGSSREESGKSKLDFTEFKVGILKDIEAIKRRIGIK